MVRAVIDANWSGGNDAVGVIARVADHTGLVSQQGQVRHRCRQVQLEFRLDPTEIAGLPNVQLDEAGQSMLGYHSPAPVLVIGRTLLQLASLLQQCLLGMDQHLPALPAFGRDALGP